MGDGESEHLDDGVVISASQREPERFGRIFDRHADAVHGLRREPGLRADAFFGFFAVATPARGATLLDALASLPTPQSTAGHCRSGGVVLHGPSRVFRVSRNGADAVITLTHGPSGTGRLWTSMTLWSKSVPPPCPQIAGTHG